VVRESTTVELVETCPAGLRVVTDQGTWLARNVIWATGYRPAYPWLGVPVLDRHGEIDHRRGAGPDARFVAAQVTAPAR
jgi:thioredoxin reductase